MTDGDAPRIITSRQTIMDGLVLGWWHTTDARIGESGVKPVLSVGRRGVLVNSFLHEVPQWWIDEANAAYEALASGNTESVKQLVTHRYDAGAMKLVKVTR